MGEANLILFRKKMKKLIFVIAVLLTAKAFAKSIEKDFAVEREEYETKSLAYQSYKPSDEPKPHTPKPYESKPYIAKPYQPSYEPKSYNAKPYQPSDEPKPYTPKPYESKPYNAKPYQPSYEPKSYNAKPYGPSYEPMKPKYEETKKDYSPCDYKSDASFENPAYSNSHDIHADEYGYKYNTAQYLAPKKYSDYKEMESPYKKEHYKKKNLDDKPEYYKYSS